MSTTTSPAPVTPPPRLGATSHAEEPGQAEGSPWSVYLQWLGDAISIVLLIAVLWWLAYHDGGWERTALAKVGLLAVFAVPAAAAELRRLPTTVRVLIGLWAMGLIASLLFAAERSGFAQPTITYALVPVVGLSAHRLWRRQWGPPAVATLLVVSFGLYWYQSFMGWWGLAMMEGRQPTWRPLSWHNQSGTLMAAFGLLFGGVALTGRRLVAIVFGLSSAAALAGAWLAGSRGTILVLIVGLVGLVLASGHARGWATAAARSVALVTATAVAVAGLTLFAQSESTGAIGQPVTSRTDSAEGTFLARFLHMDAALGMFVDAPLTGQGVGSYRNMALPFTSPDSNLTSSAHNEYAEVLGEGGLAFAVPFLGLTWVALLVAWRRSRTGRFRLDDLGDEIGPDDLRWPVSIGAVGVIVSLLLHQGADFDWAYPVIPALLAIAIGVAGTDVASTSGQPNDAGTGILRAGTGVLLASLLAAGSIGILWQNRSFEEQDDLSAEQLARVPVGWDADRATDVAYDLSRAGEHEHARWTLERAIRWNPGYHPLRVDLAIVDHSAGAISGRELVDVLLDGYLDFASTNEVAQALIEGGEHALARTVLRSLLDVYPRYETWGIDRNRADTWYLLVRTAAESDGCGSARELAEGARRAEGMDDPRFTRPIDDLVEVTCQ